MIRCNFCIRQNASVDHAYRNWKLFAVAKVKLADHIWIGKDLLILDGTSDSMLALSWIEPLIRLRGAQRKSGEQFQQCASGFRQIYPSAAHCGKIGGIGVRGWRLVVLNKPINQRPGVRISSKIAACEQFQR